MICVFGIGGELICRIAKQSYWSSLYSGPRHGLNTATSFLQSEPTLQSGTIPPVWGPVRTEEDETRPLGHNEDTVNYSNLPGGPGDLSLDQSGGAEGWGERVVLDGNNEEEDKSVLLCDNVSIQYRPLSDPHSPSPSPSSSPLPSPVPFASLPASSALPGRLPDYSQSS